MAFSPAPKSPGDLIRSQDWNEAMGEVVRLESAKLSITGGNVNGPLSVSTLNIGTAAPPNRALTVRGTGGTYLNVIANNGTHEILLGADNAGGIVSTMTNHDLQLRAGGNVTHLTVKTDGSVGIGTPSPGARLEVIGSSWEQHLRLTNTGTGGAGPGIFFNAVNRNWAILGTNATAGAGDQKLGFYDATGGQYRMVIDASGNVGIGTTGPQGKLDVNGAIRAGTSDIYFTNSIHNHTGIGNAAGFAAIENSSNFNTLMILGRTVTTSPLRRSVSVWDELNVFGPLVVGQAHRIKLGVPSGPYGNDGIRGEPNLFLDAAGTVFIKTGFQARGMDVAERFKTVEQVYAGQVVVFDEHAEAVRLCDRAYDSRVIGIASADPAFILGIDPEQMPIALCGRVPCDVDADIAPIAVGDLLTTSPTRGYAQKVIESERAAGAIIGKALSALKSGKGQILVLVFPR